MTCPGRHAFVRLLLAILAMVPIAASAEEPLGVFVSIPPQASLVQRIGGQRVTTEVLVRPGQDPHTFEPAAKQMVALARARVFFTVGLPFEEVLVGRIRANYRRLSIVDSTLGIKKRRMDADEGRDDGHGEEDHAEPAGADPHVWLSPAAIKTMAANIAKALGEVDPAHAAEYDENLKALLQDVDARDAKIRAMLAPYRGRAIYVYHPAFGYFCDAYGLEAAGGRDGRQVAHAPAASRADQAGQGRRRQGDLRPAAVRPARCANRRPGDRRRRRSGRSAGRGRVGQYGGHGPGDGRGVAAMKEPRP